MSIAAIRTVFDPEIPVNVYDLGLIYRVDITNPALIDIDMTLTAPGCPVAGEMLRRVEKAVLLAPGAKGAKVNLVFDPPWDPAKMSDEAKLELGHALISQDFLDMFLTRTGPFLKTMSEPGHGRAFCDLPDFEIDDHDARGFVLKRVGANGEGDAGRSSSRARDRTIYGFENGCPHAGERLDVELRRIHGRGRQFHCLQQAWRAIRHRHRPCFSGPCQGKALTPIKIVVDDGDVCVTGVELAEEDGLDLDETGIPEVVITSD